MLKQNKYLLNAAYFLLPVGLAIFWLLLNSQLFLSERYLNLAHQSVFKKENTIASERGRQLKISVSIAEYLNGSIGEKQLSREVKGEKDFITQGEIRHLSDVRRIFVSAGRILKGLFLPVLLLLGWRFIRGHRERWETAGWLVSVLAPIALITFVFTGFERFFLNFHMLFFPQGGWEFFSDSLLIRLYPETFWQETGIRFFLLWFIEMIISVGILTVWSRKHARKQSSLSESPVLF